ASLSKGLWPLPNRKSKRFFSGSSQEFDELRQELGGRFFGNVVSTGQGAAAHVERALAPVCERREAALDRALAAPEGEQRAAQLLADVRLVVLQVDRLGGAVVLAARVDRRGIGEAAEVLR